MTNSWLTHFQPSQLWLIHQTLTQLFLCNSFLTLSLTMTNSLRANSFPTNSFFTNSLYGKTRIFSASLSKTFRARLPSKLSATHHCGNDPTVANHNGILSTNMHEKQLKPHLQCGTDPTMIRTWSENDPRMIRPHTRPSRNRRTAEVDHRRSGTDFVWKNIGFRASAISQKRISCETSFKTPSATPPPAPLAIPFTVRERS